MTRPGDPPPATIPSPAPHPVEVRIIARSCASLAIQQMGAPLVHTLTLRNTTAGALRGLDIRLSLTHDLAPPVRIQLDSLEPGEARTFDSPHLTLRAGPLLRLEEPFDADLAGEVFTSDTLIGRASSRVRILPLDHWPGAVAPPESLAAFCLPNHPATLRLLGALRDHLTQTTGDGSLSGYQSSPARVRSITRATYDTLRALTLTYVTPPPGMGDAGQRVRLPGAILDTRMGTCLDLSLLAASVLEAAGLHPLLIVQREHAFVGLWLADETFAEPVIDSALRLRKRLELGELLVFEATGLTHPPALDASAAMSLASERLLDDASFAFALDIRAARRAGIRALALADAPTDPTQAAPQPADAHAPLAAPGSSNAAAPPLADTSPQDSIAPGPSTPRTPLPPGAERLDRWKRKLLDLSLRNRLINFRPTRQSVPLDCDDLGALEDALADGRDFRLHPADPSRPAPPDQRRAYLREELDRGRLRLPLPADELTPRLTDLFRAARSALEDSGACTLYLALGSLFWTEAPGATDLRRAPLLLLPVSLERPSAREPFVLRRFTDEPRINVTLLEKLRNDFKLDVTSLAELPEDERGVDVPKMLNRFRTLIRDIDGWEVRETCDLGLFSFSKFLMWLDLHARSTELMRSPIVARLVLGHASTPSGPSLPTPDALDTSFTPADLPCPLDADSSQLASVAAGLAGHSFVLQGPPGTGKSQTIANLIACALARGKRVLFVAEKRAALDVVRTRLDRCGLGPFCLEVHSHAAGKRDVLDQLQESVDAVRAAEPPAWPAAEADLLASRAELNALAAALHTPRPAGLSWYEATCRVLARAQSPAFAIPLPELAAINPARVEALRHAAQHLARAARPVWPIRTHPLREITRVGPDAPSRAPALIDAARSAAEHLAAALDALVTHLLAPRGSSAPGSPEAAAASPGTPPSPPPARDLSCAEREALLALAALDAPPAGFAVSEADPARWPNTRARLATCSTHANALHAARAEFEQAWSAAMLDADLDALEGSLARADARSFVLFRWWLARTPRHVLRPLARPGAPTSVPALLQAVRRAKALRAERARLAALAEPAQALGSAWNRGEPAPGAVEACLAWGDQACDVGRVLQSHPRLAPFTLAIDAQWPGAARPALAHALDAHQAFSAAWQHLAEALSHDAAALAPETGASLAGLSGVLARWRAGLSELDDWTHWRAAVAQSGEPMPGLSDALAHGIVSPDDAIDAFEKSFWHAWADATSRADPCLAGFSPNAAAGLIDRFRAADARVIELARYLVRSRLSQRLPEGAPAASEHSEMGLLQRQLKLQRRHLPVRRLIERLPNLLPRLKPCFLMSPLSVAQYLDPSHPPFDLVVFDEASQIPVWDAVGAVARASQVVIVGDSRQLPPTTFFRRLEGDDAPEEDIEELESVLDEAVAAGTPEIRLLWHYRSRHESLISFSNQRYYAGRLQTFPSARAQAPGLGVHLRRVPGVYDRSGTRTNTIEAEALVTEVVADLKAAALANRPVSLGVVTFSQAQQTLIEDLFDRARRDHPDIEPYFTQDEDPLFVKNLENVQGDERDAMYFSIGYGPDAAGHLTLGFGPLNRVGGERRLNVAVTRARSRLVVFASMNADAIDLSRTASVGAAHLRAFLEHAEQASLARARPPDDLPGELLAPARALQAALRERGYESDLAVGASPYRVDLGVRHPTDPGTYALGIEFDGPFYARAATCRDRERSRQGVLANLGWAIERVFTHEWARQPGRIIDRIVERLAQGPAGTPPPQRQQPAPAPPEARPEGSREVEAYRAIDTAKPRGTSEQFHEPSSTRALARAIIDIVNHEGPITPDLLTRRLARLWRLTRVTARVQARVAEVLASQPGMPREAEGALWPAGAGPEAFIRFRPQGQNEEDWREIEDIPAPERRAVVAGVLRANVALSLEELARQAALWMGFARATPRTDEAFADAARDLAHRNECVIDDTHVRLA